MQDSYTRAHRNRIGTLIFLQDVGQMPGASRDSTHGWPQTAVENQLGEMGSPGACSPEALCHVPVCGSAHKWCSLSVPRAWATDKPAWFL